MRLFIKMKDGLPFENPIQEDNMFYAFPDVDFGNLPDSFKEFIRVDPPKLGFYEVLASHSYELQNGFVYDVYTTREMTDEEKAIKVSGIKKDVADIIEHKKKYCQRFIDETEGNVKVAWQALMVALNNFDVESIDVEDPVLPMDPLFDNQGRLLKKNPNYTGGLPYVIA